MRLTETTQVRKLSNGCVAVYEPGKVAIIVRPGAENLSTCSWLVAYEYTEDGDRIIQDCGAAAVSLDNGFVCENGHRHFDYGTFEYFDEDEIAGMARNSIPFAANARSMAGNTL